MTEPSSPNGLSAGAWDEERSRAWLSDIDARERQLEPVSDALFEHARLVPGEVVLDVGCGSGVTTVRAAGLVAPDVGGHTAALEETGRVVGNDVSVSMIEAARSRHTRPAIEWLVADAQTHDFGTDVFDVVISRFGTMFFADPAAAFGNLARASRTGGRLVMTVWQRRGEIDFFWIPLEATLATLDRLGVSHGPPIADGTGPFSLSDPDTVGALLAGAGWRQVEFSSDRRPVYVGGPGDPEHVADSLLKGGAVDSVLTGQPVEVVAEVRQALVGLARARHDGAGLPLATATWVVTARS